MNHQRKPNAWSCAITALAMTLDILVEDVISEAGHNGGEIIFPLLEEPMCRKGFHSQEIVRIAWRHGFAMTPLELFPRILAKDHSKTHKVWEQTETEHRARFMGVLNSTFGILEGHGKRCHHAVCNHYGQIFDPDPGVPVYDFSFENCEKREFYASQLWIFTRHRL